MGHVDLNVVRIASPVKVLHASKTGGYLFVLSVEGCGWIRAEDIAFGSEAELEKYAGSPDFVVCTGDRCHSTQMRLAGTFPAGSAWVTGSRLSRAAIPGRLTLRLVDERYVRARAGVARVRCPGQRGLPSVYTPEYRRDRVQDAGKSYDWTMGWFGRNHETTLRDLFACFGFQLPFNAELFTFMGDNTRVIRPAEGKEAQYKAILANEPFVTIQTCGGGHSQLFLGEYKGERWCSIPTDTSTPVRMVRSILSGVW